METPFHDLIEEYHSEDIMSLNHSRLIHRISVALDRYGEEYDVFPELELELSTGKCKPDICVYPKMPYDWLNDVIYFKKPPVLAIEVLSPKQGLSDITDKVTKIYFPAGVETVWIVVPGLQLIQVMTSDGKRLTSTEGVLIDPITNIELDTSYIFR